MDCFYGFLVPKCEQANQSVNFVPAMAADVLVISSYRHDNLQLESDNCSTTTRS